MNAFTHEEITAYHVKLPSEHLEIAVDVISDIFFNASFPEKEIAKEANVICEEIKMYRDNPRSHVLEQIKNNLYVKPFGIFLAGKDEVVKKMTREQLLKRHREVYVPSNSIFCVVGNNSFEEVVSLAEKYCVEREGEQKDVPEIKLHSLKSEERRQGIQQTNLALGFHFPFLKDSERYSAELFLTILGQGMSSKLFLSLIHI